MRPKLTDNFYEDEFRCRCGKCNLLRLHPGFIGTLQIARTRLALPMHITSGGRCKAYNTAIGGHDKSLHICDEPQHPGQDGAIACDIAAVDGNYRGKLFVVLWDLKFSIGWNAARGFLHADLRVLLGMSQTSFNY